MTITREDLAGLKPGDVVEVVEVVGGDAITTRGPLRESEDRKYLNLGDYAVRLPDGTAAGWFATLTVVSRAPRPLYVNHPRTEPAPGDVARQADTSWPMWVYQQTQFARLGDRNNVTWRDRTGLPDRMVLLVDGETGQVVP